MEEIKNVSSMGDAACSKMLKEAILKDASVSFEEHSSSISGVVSKKYYLRRLRLFLLLKEEQETKILSNVVSELKSI